MSKQDISLNRILVDDTAVLYEDLRQQTLNVAENYRTSGKYETTLAITLGAGAILAAVSGDSGAAVVFGAVSGFTFRDAITRFHCASNHEQQANIYSDFVNGLELIPYQEPPYDWAQDEGYAIESGQQQPNSIE